MSAAGGGQRWLHVAERAGVRYTSLVRITTLRIGAGTVEACDHILAARLTRVPQQLRR